VHRFASFRLYVPSCTLHLIGESHQYITDSLRKKKKISDQLSSLIHSTTDRINASPQRNIELQSDFRLVSSIIDVEILPVTYRRVKLHRYKESKPLGFYIRDGVAIKYGSNGVENVPGVFISRLLVGGLAESTGLLSVGDEILEVNGIEVTGKTLDQVTDMMVANSHNLIITVRPQNDTFNLKRTVSSSSSSISTPRKAPMLSNTMPQSGSSTCPNGSQMNSVVSDDDDDDETDVYRSCYTQRIESHLQKTPSVLKL
jgi:partitioning defective protein 6